MIYKFKNRNDYVNDDREHENPVIGKREGVLVMSRGDDEYGVFLKDIDIIKISEDEKNAKPYKRIVRINRGRRKK